MIAILRGLLKHESTPSESGTASSFRVRAGMTAIACTSCLLLALSISPAGDIEIAQKHGIAKGQPAKLRIAILEFQGLAGEKEPLGKIFSEALTSAFAHSNRFSVIERAQLSAVVKAMDSRQTGKIAGTDAILTGTVMKLGDDIRVDARIIGVESGQILAAEKAMGKADLESISSMAEALTQKFIGRIYPATK